MGSNFNKHFTKLILLTLSTVKSFVKCFFYDVSRNSSVKDFIEDHYECLFSDKQVKI